jgi:hypothetical protein
MDHSVDLNLLSSAQEDLSENDLEATNSTGSESRKKRRQAPADSKRKPKTISDAAAQTIAQL